MMFLQRFINKISITVEKERRNSSIAIIKDIEFNLSSEFSIRKTLKDCSKKKSGITAKKNVKGKKYKR
jgi:hypothetical protein